MTAIHTNTRGMRRDAAYRMDDRHAETRAELEKLAHLLDSYWRVPGTNWRFGIDALAGLLPGVGDISTGLVSAYLVWRARGLGLPGHVILRMAGNVLADMLVGSIPVIGSIFDFGFKANRRNVKLMHRYLDRHAEHGYA